MNFDFRSILAIVLIANGFFINYMASYGKLKSKSVRRIGHLTIWVGFGLAAPFTWWEAVLLPWWSGIVGGLIAAWIMMVVMVVMGDVRQSPARRRSSR